MKYALMLGLVLAAGCNNPKYQRGEWPTDMPPEDYYATSYSADLENAKIQGPGDYFDWVLRFYKGYQIVPGWRSQETALAKLLTDEEYLALSPQIAYLGQIISAEWAKDNKLRKIDNTMLALWGKVLQKSSAAHKAGGALDRLIEDAEAVLVGRLAKSDIKNERYADLLAAKSP